MDTETLIALNLGRAILGQIAASDQVRQLQARVQELEKQLAARDADQAAAKAAGA